LSDEDFASILKSASILQSPNVCFQSDGDKITVSCFNAKDDSAHTNAIEVADGNGTEFKAVFLTENLKMVAGSYNVEISSKGISSFQNTKEEIQYWIAIEAKESTFGV
jgi:uncharacterized membrane protein